MTEPPKTLQEGIDAAGSPINLLWKPGLPGWKPPVVADEYIGWRQEQTAWDDGVAISDLSHHMRDVFVNGPDAKKLLADISANNFKNFEIGQAKQFVPVTSEGWMIQDGILARQGEDSFILTGPASSHSWVLYHGETGGYDVEFRDDPSSDFRSSGGDPVLFRYQVQGPLAMQVVEKVFGGPLPPTKFFHFTSVTLDGRSLSALRHGMAGQPGYEFIGSYEDGAYVKDALMRAGEEFGMAHVGALAYSTNSLESGWIPVPTPGIYTSPELAGYRNWLPFFSFEAQGGLNGTFFSEDIEDYYVTPFELGYGRSVSLEHDFIGRDALARLKDDVRRTKVTLEITGSDRDVFGAGFFLTHGRFRVEADGELVGTTYHTGPIAHLGVVLSLAIVDREHAEPGTEVTLVWGEHPGPGTGPAADVAFEQVRATVRPAPYNEFARTGYRTAVV